MLKRMIRRWLMNEDDASAAKRLCTVEARYTQALLALERIEKDLKETPKYEVGGVPGIFHSAWFDGDKRETLADRVKCLEKDLRKLSDEFHFLTEHLKVRKTTSAERTYFAPVKRKK